MRTNPFLLLFILAFGLITLIVGINVPFALLLLVTGLCFVLTFRYSLKGFPLVLFLIAFITRLVFILVVDTPLISDFKMLYEAGVSYANGDYSFSLDQYFSEWAYQTGFVIYEGIIIKIFGAKSAFLVLKLLNAVFSSATFVFIYWILKNYIREKVAQFCALFGSFLIFPLTFVTVLSNQQLSTFFMVIGLFFFTEKNITLKPWVRGALSGLFFALGNIIRPEGMVVLAALVIFFLLRLVNPRHERRGAILSMGILLFFIYFSLNFLASQWIMGSGVNPQGLKNNNSLYKFVVGLNHETKGLYSDADVDAIYGQEMSKEERDKLEVQMIIQRLSAGPKKLLALLVSKQQLLWGGNPVIWSYQHLLDAEKSVNLLGIEIPMVKVGELLWRLHNLQIFLLFALSVMGGAFLLRGTMNHYFMVYYLVLLMSAAAFLLIEVQPRYIYFPQHLLVITTAIGFEGMLQRFGQKQPKAQGPMLPL